MGVTRDTATEGSSSIRAAVTGCFKIRTRRKAEKEIGDSVMKKWLAKIGIKFGDRKDGGLGFW